MEAATQVLTLVAGSARDDTLWTALESAAAVLLTVEDPQPVVYCHVVVEAVSFAAKRPGGDRKRHMFVLENAVMRLAVACNRGSLPSLPPDTAKLPSTDWRFFRGVFERLQDCIAMVAAASEDSQRLALLMLSRLAVLLSCCWLLDDRATNASKATDLLTISSEALLARSSVEYLAAGPLFMLAMMSLVEHRDKHKALAQFELAQSSMKSRASDYEMSKGMIPLGVFNYWFAITLAQNGKFAEAGVALKKCVRANYEPPACLILSALMRMQALDYCEAAEELQRALEIDFAQSVAMFDYALLLGRMGNYEDQFRMLEYFQEAVSLDDDDMHNSKKRQRTPGLTLDLEQHGSQHRSPPSLLDDVKLRAVLPSKLSHVSTAMVHFHLALAAMENGENSKLGW